MALSFAQERQWFMQQLEPEDVSYLVPAAIRLDGALDREALAQALEMGGFYARGKVVLALNDLVAAGTVELILAPEGTPQLQKVNHIQYRWRA